MNRTRISRALVGVLVLTFTVGGVVYAIAHRANRAAGSAAKADPLSGNSVAALMSLSEQPTSRPSSNTDASRNKLTGLTDASKTSPHAGASNGAAGTSASSDRTIADKAASQSTAITASATIAPDPLAQGKAKIAAGDLLAGRKIINDALNAGSVDADAARAAIADVNNSLVFSPRVTEGDPFTSRYVVKSGDSLNKIANKFDVTAALLLRINGLADARKLQAGRPIKVILGPFHALVTKSKFTLDLYLGGSPGEKGAMYVCSYRVGLGKDDSTPTGTWLVEPHRKLANPKYYSPRGEGTVEAGDPKNPLGKFWIGLQGMDGQAVNKTSYGIHGTIEPDSIGKQSSMGCIRMHNEDVALVYQMLVEGKSTVIVK